MSAHKMPVPPFEAWVEAVERHSKAVGADPAAVFAGRRDAPVRLARWEAWRELLDVYGGSMLGLAKLTGFDHSTIFNAMQGLPRARAQHRKRFPKPEPTPVKFESLEARMRHQWKQSAKQTRVYGRAN